MDAKRSGNKESRVKYENKIFDLVLNLNNLSNIKGGLEKVKDNAIAAEESKTVSLESRYALESESRISNSIQRRALRME